MPASYHTGSRGFVGFEARLSNPAGTVFGTVIPAFVQVDEAGNSLGSASTPYSQASAPTANAANALTPQTNQGQFSLVVKASAGNFYGGSITAGATAGFLIAYNASSAPANGAALTAALVLGVIQVGANQTGGLGDYAIPDRFSNGVTLLFSTSLTTFTQPANPAVFLRGRAA